MINTEKKSNSSFWNSSLWIEISGFRYFLALVSSLQHLFVASPGKFITCHWHDGIMKKLILPHCSSQTSVKTSQCTEHQFIRAAGHWDDQWDLNDLCQRWEHDSSQQAENTVHVCDRKARSLSGQRLFGLIGQEDNWKFLGFKKFGHHLMITDKYCSSMVLTPT